MRGLRRSKKRRPSSVSSASISTASTRGGGEEVAEGAGDGAARRCRGSRSAAGGAARAAARQHQVPVPVVAGQVAAGPVERVDRLALVQLQHPVAVGPFDHPRVLVGGLGLVEDAARVGGLDRPRGIASAAPAERPAPPRSASRAPPRATRARARAKTRKVRWVPAKRDQQQRGDHRPEQRAGGRDRVEPPDHLAGALDLADRQPHRPGRGGAEQGHRHRDQDQHAEQRAGEAADRDGVEGVDREAEEGPGGEGDQRRSAPPRRGPAGRAPAGAGGGRRSGRRTSSRPRGRRGRPRSCSPRRSSRRRSRAPAAAPRRSRRRGWRRRRRRRGPSEQALSPLPAHAPCPRPLSRFSSSSPWPAATARPARASSSWTPRSVGEVEQALLLDPLAGDLEEDPGEHAEGEEGALDHHHHAGRALVGERRDPPVALARRVDRVEHRPRPHQHVAEDRPGEADRDHVADLPAGAEPLRLRQRPEDRHPHQAAEEEEGRVLERVHRRGPVGVLVERRDVPEEEVERPEREGDGRVGEDLSRSKKRIARIGCSSGPVRPRTSSRVAMSPISRCSPMWAITSSSAMWPIGENRATTIISRPAAKQAWRQTGTGRPFAARVSARFA